MSGYVPDFAFTAVITDTAFGLGLAKAGEGGYFPQPHLGEWPTYDEAQAEARAQNARIGISEYRAFELVCESMRLQGNGA